MPCSIDWSSRGDRHKLLLTAPAKGSLGQYSAYATLALGSALALFLYPHSITGLLSASGRKVIKRNMALLPIYSLVLALIAFLGYMALAAGVQQDATYAPTSRNTAPTSRCRPSSCARSQAGSRV